MKEELKELNAKLEKVSDRLSSIDITLAKQEVNLEDHIRRTEIAEERLGHMEGILIPLQKHANQIDGGLKLLGAIVTVLGVVAGFIKVLF